MLTRMFSFVTEKVGMSIGGIVAGAVCCLMVCGICLAVPVGEVTRTYNGVERVGPISIDKTGDVLECSCRYLKTYNGEVVEEFGRTVIVFEVPWDTVPATIQDALTVISGYVDGKIAEDAAGGG